MPTNGKEKTGYPNQKPEGVLKRVIEASSSIAAAQRALAVGRQRA